MAALKYKEEGDQPLAHLERKLLGEFIIWKTYLWWMRELTNVMKIHQTMSARLWVERLVAFWKTWCMARKKQNVIPFEYAARHIHDINLLGLLGLSLNSNLLDFLVVS
jgi:hypothetical protein